MNRRIGSARRWVLIAVCSLAPLAVPAVAGAHAALEQANPRLGATLRTGPRQLTLSYDEDVVPRYARVAVVGPHGQNIAGAPQVTGSVVVIPLRPAPIGSYVVRWRMVASDDGHTTEGAFSFGVRVKPQPPGPVSGVGIPAAPEVLAWLEFVAVVLAGGVLTFRALVWGPAGRAGTDVDARIPMWLATAGAVIGLHAGLFAFLVGAYPIVGGGGLSGFANTLIEPIRTGTHLGQAWTVTAFAWLAVLALIVAAWVIPRRRDALLAAAGVCALAVGFGISWASHPASHGSLALVADYLHLLAGALWVGGLVSLVILAAGARSASGPQREAIARTCILRFSKLALPTVAVVGAAGVYLALRELPSLSAVTSSRYGVVLLAKSSVVLAALAFAAYHRRFVVPRLESGARVATMRRTLALELGLLLTVLLLAAVLSQSAPPG